MIRFTYILALFLGFVFAINPAFSLDNNIGEEKKEGEQKLYAKGKKALLERNFSEAAEAFKQLTELSTNNPEYQFLAGLSFFASPTGSPQSIQYFETAIGLFSGDTIAEAYYYLGRARCLNGKYEEGLEAFNEFERFLVSTKKTGQEMQSEVARRKNNARFALENAGNVNTDVEIINIGTGVNGLFPDYAPVIAPDGRHLLFTSRRPETTGGKKAFDEHYYEDIYVADNLSGEWKLSEESVSADYLFKDYNTSKQDAGVVFTQDGKRLYVYRNDKIYQSVFENGAWTQPEKLGEIDMKAKHAPSVSLTEDGKTMYFINNSSTGFGGRDLFVTTQNSEGEWGTAVNMGKPLNTHGNEDAPFISEDGNTLYFSSDGHAGMGGYDLFKSEKLEDGTWGKPVNLGLPLNSPADDIYYVETKGGESAFFSSSRVGSHGGMDIYYVNLNPVAIDIQLAGIAFDPDEKAPLAVAITLTDTETNEVVGEYNTDNKTGAYHISVPSDRSYIMTVTEDGGETYTQTLNIPKQTQEYTSFQMLEIRNLNNDDGQIFAQELMIRTGLYNVDELAEENKDGLDQEAMKAILSFAGNEDDFSDKLLWSAYFNDGEITADDPKYTLWKETKEFEVFANLNPAELGARGMFKQMFSYNEREIATAKTTYTEWLDLIAAVAKANDGEVTLYIEASASRVPTRTHKSNMRLSKMRSDGAKEIILATLKERGIDISKIKWDEQLLVQGPKYIGDFESPEKYEPWQYVIIQVK